MQWERIGTGRVIAAVVAVGAVGVLGTALVARTAAAQAGLPPASPSTVTVVGEGEASGAPDVAHVTVGVQTRGATAVQASDENARRMAAVLDTLRGQGVAPQDIQTSGLSVNAEYRPPAPLPAEAGRPGAPGAVPGMPEPAGYQASNTVTVTVQQVERAGALLDAALAASANQVGGIRFAIKDPTALRQQAMDEATDAARRKAEHLAGRLGLRLVGISSVAEESGTTPFPVPEMAAARSVGGSFAPPIEGGTLRVTARVRIAFQFQ
jgi:uncharacterized protein YggE